ncbi:7-cyano-7-deazaguanine synthase QueC [Leptospira wolffii]|uniref:7-cyano-7-deazaguanine synthase QueC n=1 Tax=Leptospira wolffii TaxID=409998 RepID=UPI000348F9C3|nr:7-cyano-7-deazaguanine synthase QueC [Leptospira wolffii]TGK61620.1 7-cyano-7-deazaguanine synthase QueC [Leptospira wolffii]TGK70164.1 7-cyano-7-deazaguanine synthase QueC [Leptospira wolffii]TGK77087.1 7-cyano-7-deazaguanine synthase QueC [Leptospira wolffii]TGL31061.1 7-cyano-7-deazaguanine synthase QueC [Leptospira wolffii]
MATPRKSNGVRNSSALPKAVVLFSGGLDSTTCLYQCIEDGYSPTALSFDYNQRHREELKSAKKIAKLLQVPHMIQKLQPEFFLGSSLTERRIKVPKNALGDKKIPNTYVPGRNILFLSFGVSLAEGIGADRLYIGVNALDYSGYPDCRPEFIRAYAEAVRLGTKMGAEGRPLEIRTPLQHLDKKEIVLLGSKLGVPFSLTHSCYDPIQGKPCGKCDSCLLRKKGFQEAGIPEK